MREAIRWTAPMKAPSPPPTIPSLILSPFAASLRPSIAMLCVSSRRGMLAQSWRIGQRGLGCRSGGLAAARLQNRNLKALNRDGVRMIGPVPSRYRRPKRLAASHDGPCARVDRRPAGMRHAERGLHTRGLPASEAGRAAFRRALRKGVGAKMKALRFIGSPARAGYALGAVLVGALALTALGPLVPNEALSALRALIPGETPFLELVLLGWLGVALGRLTMRAAQAPAQRGGQAAARQEAAAREEKVDRVLRHVSKVLQAHLTDSESFSERLDGASERLSRQETVGPIKEIVLALIEDNRDMREKLYSVRNQLEESRLQVVRLQSNLERAEEAGLRDVVTAIGNRRFFNACFIEEVEKARKGGDNLCLALTDIDKFKQVNDRFGHLVGDRLLRLFAGILVKNVRGQDKVARFGGEEFALIFPGARLAEAATAVERIR